MGQILLLAAGLMVLTVISAGSVYLVNKAREDARWVVHTVESENQISFTQFAGLSTPSNPKTRYPSPNCNCAGPKAHSAVFF